jgi:hypothetical protein
MSRSHSYFNRLKASRQRVKRRIASKPETRTRNLAALTEPETVQPLSPPPAIDAGPAPEL